MPLPSWDCVNGACLDPGTGLGAYTSLGACNIACVAVTPSWDCSSFGCYDPGTGQGASFLIILYVIVFVLWWFHLGIAQ